MTHNPHAAQIFVPAVSSILKYLFPPPKHDSKRVITFANQASQGTGLSGRSAQECTANCGQPLLIHCGQPLLIQRGAFYAPRPICRCHATG